MSGKRPDIERLPHGPAVAAKLEATSGDRQLGFFFEEPGPAARPSPPPEPAAGQATPARRPPRTRPDTLPAWARAAMPPEPEPPQDEADELEAARRIWRVAELVSDVRTHIEQAYADLWVRGEISNLRAAPSGHMYFTLKDGDAQLPAVLFRRQAQLLRFRPEDGLEVLLRGRVSVYEQRGQMQLIAEYLEPVGAGSLQVAIEQLKRKLEAEGLFAMDRKRPLPAFPHCVGIVTSPTGAVIRDFLNVAGRRHAKLDVLLFPAVVQGDQAAAEIAAGIAYFNRTRSVAVIVIARGGGSLEDLASFNSEVVARAIAASVLPVVSAVGHETDFTIADFVADLRAPTPSAAAELITTAQHRIEEQIESLGQRLGRAVRYTLAVGRQQVARTAMDASLAKLRDSFGRREQRVDEQRFRMERAQTATLRTAAERLQRTAAALLRQDATQRLHLMRERFATLQLRLERGANERLCAAQQRHLRGAATLDRYDARLVLARSSEKLSLSRDRLSRAMAARIAGARSHHGLAVRSLASLSPLAVLGRGYALAFAADGTVLTSADAASPGEAIHVQLAAGTLDAAVIRTNMRKPGQER